MEVIREIRELTGLSQEKMANFFGISKNYLQFVEKGKRNLSSKANIKLSGLILLFEQVKADMASNNKLKNAVPVSAEKLAMQHKKKMEFHRRSAIGLSIQLRKLKDKHPKINHRLSLIEAMKNNDTGLYKADKGDKMWMEIIEFFSGERKQESSPEEQELLQDKIDTHLAHAEVHRLRMEMYLGMG